jgi:gliding motility-associated-like protein
MVSVLPLPVAYAGVDTITCKGTGVYLQASGGNFYQWSPLTGLNNTNISSPLASPTTPTTYTVTVTGANNCTNTDQVFVDVNPMPHSDFSVIPTVGCDGLELKFVNQSTNDQSYTWLFGDGNSTTTEQDPTHLYAFGVPYTISLITVNNFCIDTMTIQKPELGIGSALDSLQNVFTPNGDGLNDCFRITPVGGLSDCATMTVFNRWGELVFEGSPAIGCWNGKNKSGNDCPAGVYFFVVKIGNATQNGSVQLIR